MLLREMILLFCLLVVSGSAFRTLKFSRRCQRTPMYEKKTDDVPNPLTKAAWFGVEAFGKAFGKSKTKELESSNGPPKSLQETLDRIRADNDREYFLSGQIDKEIYDPDCTFADPFVSFNGRDRFVENLAKLGSFITEYSAKPLDYQIIDKTVNTKFMVKLRLNLPWKPVLAWPWGVKCEIDPTTFLVVRHEESWDVSPLEGVQQIFRKPRTKV